MKFSIITINRNNSKGLERTIESIVNQSFREYEHIIIDGDSSDESVKIVKKYNDKISYWVSEPDKGVYNAMNKGIKRATGEYCLFLNSGDCFFNNEVLNDAFNSNFSEDIVYGSIVMSNGDRFEYSNENEISFRYFITCTLPHSCTFIKTVLFEKIGYFNENLKIVSDWEFFLLAICKYNVQIKKIALVIAVFDLNGISSISSNKDLIVQEKNHELSILFPRFLDDYKRLEDIEKQLIWIKSNLFFRVILKLQRIFGNFINKKTKDLLN
jgi:glycosyltransferase involved in cell wall biosynthesis